MLKKASDTRIAYLLIASAYCFLPELEALKFVRASSVCVRHYALKLPANSETVSPVA